MFKNPPAGADAPAAATTETDQLAELTARVTSLEAKVATLADQLDAPDGICNRLQALERLAGPKLTGKSKRPPSNRTPIVRRKINYSGERRVAPKRITAGWTPGTPTKDNRKPRA